MQLIHIPTLFVRGKRDPMAHFVTLTEGLLDESKMTAYSWNGGHEPPNSGERGLWAQMAQRLLEILDQE